MLLLTKYAAMHKNNELDVSTHRTTIRLYNHLLYKVRKWLFWENTCSLSLTRHCSKIKHNFIQPDSLFPLAAEFMSIILQDRRFRSIRKLPTCFM